jgi:hypothetical protein
MTTIADLIARAHLNPNDPKALADIARELQRMGIISAPPLALEEKETRYFNDDGSLAVAPSLIFTEVDGAEPNDAAWRQAETLSVSAPQSAAAYLSWASVMANETHGNYSTRTLFFRSCPDSLTCVAAAA